MALRVDHPGDVGGCAGRQEDAIATHRGDAGIDDWIEIEREADRGLLMTVDVEDRIGAAAADLATHAACK